jgi:type VI secretion system secreted protein VgrG
VLAQFTSAVTPNPNAVFSPFTFARGINLRTYLAIDAGSAFANPVSGIYAIFSYDQMAEGVQWTALWYRNGELVHYETKPWDGGTGGLGYTEWLADAEEWLPGSYQVQIFVGTEVKVAGSFEVTGQPATSTATPLPSATPTATPSRTSTPTITATHTRQPTATAP